MTAKIPIQNGKYAIVDKEDYERVNNFIWYYHKRNKNVWTEIDGEIIQLSHFILNEKPKGLFIAHRDKDDLNFTKSNLVYVDYKERQRLSKGHVNSTSKYKGVSYDRSRNKWVAQARINGKNKFIGRFDNEDDAARAYNRVIKEYCGETAYLNNIGVDNNRKSDEKESTPIMQRTKTNTKNKYRGVTKSYKEKWLSRMYIDGKREYLGCFSTPVEAAKAYDKKAYELYGDKAILNFPELIGEYKREVTNNGS